MPRDLFATAPAAAPRDLFAPAVDVQGMRRALMQAHDSGNLDEERRLSLALKQIDTPPMTLGETTIKPVSKDSFYQPGFKPMDEAAAFATSTINQIPVVGPVIEKGIAEGQAYLHNTYKPEDIPISPSDVQNTFRQQEHANPKGTTAGKVVGGVLPYAVASEFALPAKALGLEGSLFSRVGFGVPSQFAINTGDKMTREGQSLPDAAVDSILPTLLTAPLALFGAPTAAGKVVTAELKRAGITAEDVQAALKDMGPAAVVGDLTPRLQARTGAVATSPGPGQDMVTKALMDRAAGANARIKGSVEDTFGPEPVPSRIAGEIDTARKQANAAYEPVLRENALGPSMGVYDATPLAQAIDTTIPNLVGGTRQQVEQVRKMLINPQTGKLTTDPQIILAVRHELDGVIEGLAGPGGNRTTAGVLSDLRKLIDNDLAQQVPGIKWADAGRAEVGAQERAFELGRNALKNGDNAIHPVDFRNQLDELSGPQGSAVGPRSTPNVVPQRVTEGMLSRVYQAIGTTANDRVALKQLLKGDGSWNREKMVAAFGPEKTDEFVRLLDNEATMATTENLAFGNSKTSLLQSAKEGLEPSSNPGVIRALLNTKAGDAIWTAADRLTGGMASAERSKANEAIAKALLSRGTASLPSALKNGRLSLTHIARALIAQQIAAD